MDVYEAVTSRRAVRGFTDEPVSREVLERVLSAAVNSEVALLCLVTSQRLRGALASLPSKARGSRCAGHCHTDWQRNGECYA
jgi:Nitroreductase family